MLLLKFLDPRSFRFYFEIGLNCRSHCCKTRENNLYTFGVGSGSEAELESGLPMGERERKRERERWDKDGLGCACSLARAKRRYKPFRTVHITARCHRGNTFSRVLPGRSCVERTAVVHRSFLDLRSVAF